MTDRVAPTWPADNVERRPVDRLIPYARNARTHSDEQVAQIAASMREWGWTVPILVDEADGIIAGHGRLLAARKLGLTDVPVVVARGWSEAQKRAYVLADNQLALNAGWDTELLKVELTALRDEFRFDVGLIGFSPGELAGLFDEPVDDEGGDGTGGGTGDGSGKHPGANGALVDRFGLPPFTVLNAREGWWQDRKAAWIAIGIKSELGRGGSGPDDAAPGGSALPAADYSKTKARGDGRGRAIGGTDRG
ncbi:MAG: ParB/Srx family N-terminal domain-containing protein [Gemmatimonadota bacterium]